MDAWTIVYAVTAAIMVIGIIMWTKKSQEEPDEPGTLQAKKALENDGVDKMISSRRRYASSHGFSLVEKVQLGSGDKQTVLDAAIVTYNGVVGVRCVGKNGQIYANPGDKEWLWIAGGQRQTFISPIDQASADTRLLRDKLFAAGLRNMRVETFPVFTSQNLSTAVPKSMQPPRPKELMSKLEGEKYLEDTGFDKDAAVKALQA